VKRGVPLRVEIGPRDVDARVAMVARRDRGPKDKASMPRAELVATVPAILEDMQKGLFARARSYRDANTRAIDTRAEFDAFFTPKNEREIHGGFALAPWCGDAACEAALKEALKVTIRCIPLGGAEGAPWEAKIREDGPCVACGRIGKDERSSAERLRSRVVFAKAY
jgi:prolyl-tRNA synthetase